MKFKNLKIRAKLLLGFGFVIILASILGLRGYYSLRELDNSLMKIANVELPKVNTLASLSLELTKIKT